MKNINVNRQNSIFILFGLLILFSSTNLFSQEYNYTGTLSYLDGTPFNLSGTNIDDFDVDLVRAPDLYAGYVKNVKDGTIILSCVVTGTYTLKFMDIEIVKFNVSDVGGKLESNLSGTLSLPFNYIAKTDPNQTVKIYDDNINLIDSFQANENGYVPLKENEEYYSNKFLVVEPENQFPQPAFFKEIKPANVGKLSYRKLSFPSQKLQAKKGLVHNVRDDIYYAMRKVTFNKDKNKILWLLQEYEIDSRKGSIHKLDFSNYKKATGIDLYLDESGIVVAVLKQPKSPTAYDYQSIIVSKNGDLLASDNTFIYPYYRFKNNFVGGIYWIIPTFNGIPLNEGMHNFDITCDGSWIDPNPDHQNWRKRMNELQGDIEVAAEDGNGDRVAELQKRRAELIQNEPKPLGFDRSGSKTSTESYNVVFSPKEPYLWRVDDVEGNSEDLREIDKIEKKRCYLSIDGGHVMDYSYPDPDAGKGIMYMDFASAEARKEALASALSKAKVYVGFEREPSPWGTMFKLFDGTMDITNGGLPINMWEGPYPELRYAYREILGEYASIKEAREHCQNPQHSKGKYYCYEEKVISVCLDYYDYYDFIIKDGKISPDYKKLYCGIEQWGNKDDEEIIDDVVRERKIQKIKEIPQQRDTPLSNPVNSHTSEPTSTEKLSEISNKLPVINFEIGTVSGGNFEAPVWIKFYPIGTYDPDGYIVLFEMDMDGDGTFDVQEKTLAGGSYEFTQPGNYTVTVRVTDDKGGVATKSKSFTIIGSDYTYTEPQKTHQPVEKRKPENVELDKKLDSIIENYKQQDEKPVTTKNDVVVVPKKFDKKEEKQKESKQKTRNATEKKNDAFSIVDKNENILVNGSFEEGPPVGSFKWFSKGVGIPGWSITRATVDLVGNYFRSADGNNSLDLNGTSYGEIQQKISTKKGKQYRLSFYLAGNPAGEPTIKKLLVIVGDKSKKYQFDITGKNVKEMGWEYHELIFTAKGRSTILTFGSNHKSGPADAGPVIDNVKVFEIETEEVVEETQILKEIVLDDSVIRPMADSYVYAYEYRNWDKANFGLSEFLTIGWHSTGGEQRTYLKFDLQNINIETLGKAVLKLYHHSTIGKNIHTIGIHNVLENWEEGIGTFHSGQSEDIDTTGAVTWDVQPAFIDSSIVQFKPKKKNKKNKFIEIDITPLVKDWILGTPNNGILLKPEGYLSGRLPTSIYKFYSKDCEDSAKAPQIEIQLK